MSFLMGLRDEPTTESLHKWNAWLAAIFFFQATVILLLSTTKTFPIHLSLLNIDSLQSTATGSVVLAPATHHVLDLNMAQLMALLLALSGLVHLAMATWWRNRYENDLKAGVNHLRWIEYAFTAAIMLGAVAVLSGMYDLVSLGLLFVLSLLLHGGCWLVESLHSKRHTVHMQWISYVVVLLSGGAAWLAILVYLLATNVFGGGHIPGFVYWLAASAFVLCCAFAALLFLELSRPEFYKKYLRIERFYMIISVVMKTAVAWQIFAGVLKP
jgi:hypothetical protein